MSEVNLLDTYWVHLSGQTKRARIHHWDCRYCNSGTGMAKRPAYPGGATVWTSYKSLDDARAFVNLLPFTDKSVCKACFPPAPPDGWIEF
jgi:hypothetical protein